MMKVAIAILAVAPAMLILLCILFVLNVLQIGEKPKHLNTNAGITLCIADSNECTHAKPLPKKDDLP